LALARNARKAAVIASLLGAGTVLLYFSQRSNRANVVLKMGYNNFPPFVVTGSDGAPSGLAVEIVKAAAARTHIELKWVAAGDGLDSALRKGVVDIYPMLTLTPERVAEFHTSESWWENESALVSLATTRMHAGPETAGKKIAIRGLPVLKAIATKVFPRAELEIIPRVDDMAEALCRGKVQGVFLDVRLLQSQLLRGPVVCAGHPLYVASVERGNLSLGSVARKEVAGTADRLYAAIAELAIDGTLSQAASRWSMISSFQNRHMKEILEARQRAALMRYGMAGLIVILVLTWLQTNRIRRARVAAEESRQRFDAFMKHIPAIAFIRNEGGRVVYSNRPLPAPFDDEVVADGVALTCAETTESVILPSGERQDFLCLRFPFVNRSGGRFMGSVALDITERKKAEEALRFSQFSIDRSPDSILWLDSNERIFYANEAVARELGYRRSDFAGMTLSDIDATLVLRKLEMNRYDSSVKATTAESSWRTQSGAMLPVEVALYHVEFDGNDFVCCMARNITERKRVEAELSYQAQHDLLTGLPNRRALEGGLNLSIRAAEENQCGLAVLYCDLDGFKLINDTLGHTLGDDLLKQLVNRLKCSVRPQDTLARMGGDEFALIAPGIDSEETARPVADRLIQCLEESFWLNGHELMVTASVGCSLFPRDCVDGSMLLQHADAAMYEAKRQGKNRIRYFRPEMNTAVRERLELENHLRRALDRGELSLHYQPEITLGSNRVARYEALLRWTHPVFGSISPARFIPIAEETGLIVPIGTWVLEEACRYGRQLLDSGINAGVGVNVSSVQFGRSNFIETVTSILERTGLPPRMLDLELTETAVMQEIEDATQKIRSLRAGGITISIDDFGTGYSSLSYLLKLRTDNLKIDRSFIRNVPRDSNAVSLTQGLVSLAHSLGMKVVIEGVETRQQLEAIRLMGCDMAQGYLLGRPAAAMRFEERAPANTPEEALTL